MKVSMHILKDWLRNFQPEAVCPQGEIRISEVRLYQKEEVLQPHILYLGTAERFSLGKGNRIICKNLSDFLVLKTNDLSAVLNQVLEAFSFYARWEEEIERRINAGCSLSEILDVAEVLLRVPVQVVDAAQVRIGKSFGNAGYKDTKDWKQAMESPGYSAEVLSRFNQKYRSTFERKDVFFLPNDFFPTTAWCKHIFLEGERYATLIVPADSHTFSRGELQLVEMTADQILKWIRSSNESDAAAKTTSYLARVLDGTPQAEEEMGTWLSNAGWQEDCSKQICVASVISESFYMEALLSRLLMEQSKGIVAIPYQRHLVVLGNTDLMEVSEFTEFFRSFLMQNHYYGAYSLPFHDLHQVAEAYRQTLQTLEASEPVVGALYSSTDNAMRYITGIVRKESRLDLVHPLLREMTDYDAKHHTEYFDTLFAYLKNERNHQLTAQELFIHRNTLFKRLRKMETLWPLSLEDPENRFYLLYSCYQLAYTSASF